MKNKKLILILSILLILLVVIITVIIIFKNKSTTVTDDSSSKPPIGFGSDTKVKVNKNGENTTLMVGQTNNGNDNYTYISARIDKSASKQDQAFALIGAIAHSVGYKVNINYIEIESDKIKVDFSNDAAPFEINESYVGNGQENYAIVSENGVAKTIFDSIAKTFESYFGNEMNIYFSVNDKDILITDITPKINISSDKPYNYK